MSRRARLPRHLHPGAWWLWALGLAAAATRTTNPLLLVLIIAVAGYVVAARRTDAPWARSYAFFLKVGAVVVLVRVVFQVLFGATVPGRTVLVELPELGLPAWVAGIRVGGAVTLESVLVALYEGLKLATILACVGAANALVNPTRLLRALPSALYEAGVAVVVAMTVAPQLVQSVARVGEARRLRGRPHRGIRAVRGTALPVLEGALERSIALAAAMDSRGYGRRGDVPAPVRRAAGGLVLAGLLGICAGTYGLLSVGFPTALQLPLLLAGVTCAAAGMAAAGRRSVRTRYRPDPWAWPEWAVAAAGLAVGAAFVAAAAAGVPALVLQTSPAAWPALPLVPAAAVLAGLLPAWLAPQPPQRPRRPQPTPPPPRKPRANRRPVPAREAAR